MTEWSQGSQEEDESFAHFQDSILLSKLLDPYDSCATYKLLYTKSLIDFLPIASDMVCFFQKEEYKTIDTSTAVNHLAFKLYYLKLVVEMGTAVYRDDEKFISENLHAFLVDVMINILVCEKKCENTQYRRQTISIIFRSLSTCLIDATEIIN